MESVKKAVLQIKSLLTSDLPNRKVPVEIHLHPEDISQVRIAAQLKGMDFNEFCALAIHKATRDIRAHL